MRPAASSTIVLFRTRRAAQPQAPNTPRSSAIWVDDSTTLRHANGVSKDMRWQSFAVPWTIKQPTNHHVDGVFIRHDRWNWLLSSCDSTFYIAVESALDDNHVIATPWHTRSLVDISYTGPREDKQSSAPFYQRRSHNLFSLMCAAYTGVLRIWSWSCASALGGAEFLWWMLSWSVVKSPVLVAFLALTSKRAGIQLGYED